METPLTKNIKPDREPLDLAGYEKAGGYEGARAALKMAPTEVQEEVKNSTLRGRGGAGFPTGVKWQALPMNDPRRRYLLVNADEMEPGTMKDRVLLEGDPHMLLEGMIISAYAIQADTAYVFLRWGYHLAAERIQRAIGELYTKGYLGKKLFGSDFKLDIHLHVSAGRYMCGEETGLINALEGKRANPRSKPPFPQVSGLWGKPTVVNNVETVCNIPHILAKGAEWFKGLSASPDGGTKLYGASGKVKHPGIWELPLGVTVREVLEEHAGGMRDGVAFRGLLPGGASTDFLLPEHLDAKMDFTDMEKIGSRLGTGTMIVLDNKTCPVGMCLNLEEFFAKESCGWCTPCREGIPWVARTLRAIENGQGKPEDLDVLNFHVQWVGPPGRTFCALAPGAMEPLGSALKYFKDDFQRHIDDKRCPWS